ncbi:hypothetical protein [Paraurantiacibacter namhicola]|uniref:Secreted protein n=1 Tax=Paraurantiacibacter namhicola TaxID=645517 RepID=A0A1C7D6H0_9SPHN|nr:hypothetical protein [Paraurantiacibacter namhicola]ANU06903.1 hypothetical protein A6F65_00580 [Paraurantiacibacter namhicola]
MKRTGIVLSSLSVALLAMAQPALAQVADTRSADAIPQTGASNPYIREVIRVEEGAAAIIPPPSVGFLPYLIGPLLLGLGLVALGGGGGGSVGSGGPDSPG